MNKKGQELSVSVIIVAVLALLVLVVIAFIFTGKIGTFATATADCEKIAGSDCQFGGCDPGYTQDNTRKCYDDNQETGAVCCIPVSS